MMFGVAKSSFDPGENIEEREEQMIITLNTIQ